MSLKIDNSLLISGGLASQMKRRTLPGVEQLQRARAQTSPQISEEIKSLATRENDSVRAAKESPENFKIKKIEPIVPPNLEKPVKIDIRA